VVTDLKIVHFSKVETIMLSNSLYRMSRYLQQQAFQRNYPALASRFSVAKQAPVKRMNFMNSAKVLKPLQPDVLGFAGGKKSTRECPLWMGGMNTVVIFFISCTLGGLWNEVKISRACRCKCSEDGSAGSVGEVT
jgi:hypothetical protein